MCACMHISTRDLVWDAGKVKSVIGCGRTLQIYEKKESLKNWRGGSKPKLHFGLGFWRATQNNYFLFAAGPIFKISLLINCVKPVAHVCGRGSLEFMPQVFMMVYTAQRPSCSSSRLNLICTFKALLGSALAPRHGDRINSVFLPDSGKRQLDFPSRWGWGMLPDEPVHLHSLHLVSDSEGDLPSYVSSLDLVSPINRQFAFWCV